ncbi:putative RNA recognition motif 2, nucleotide-binding alpha-beta plait domain protein [Tanacetum coccineum]
MANQTCSKKPLDPMAPPYQKKFPANYFFYTYKSPPYYHHLPPFYLYNNNLQQPSPSSLTSVPVGPRNPKPCLPRGKYWKAKKIVVRQWRPKNVVEDKKETQVKVVEKQQQKRRKLMIQTLDNHCRIENAKGFVTSYDFLYLPMDFFKQANGGFAFVNFTSPQGALRFKDVFHGKRWDLFGSPKIAEITRARIQGKEALIKNCMAMDFTFGSEEDMPVWFEPARDGSGRITSKIIPVGLNRQVTR